MKKILAVCVLLLLSLLVAWWWKGTGEDPRLLRTIDVKTTGDFGAMLSVNPDGSQFASGIGDWGDNLIIWDSEGFAQKRITKNHNSLIDIQSADRSNYATVTGIVFSPEWDNFVWWRQQNNHLTALGLWRFSGQDEISSLLPERFAGGYSGVYSVAVSPQGKRIAFHGFNEETKKLELCLHWPRKLSEEPSGRSKLIAFEGVSEHDTIRRMAFSPDGDRLLGIGVGHDIYMWDLVDDRLAFTIKNAAGDATRYGNDTLVFSPDSKRFALQEEGTDEVVRIRSSLDGSIEREFTMGWGTVCLGFSPDWKWYAIKNPMSKVLEIHSIEDGRLAHAFKGSDGDFLDAAFSGDSRRMVTSSRDRLYRIWDLTDLASP